MAPELYPYQREVIARVHAAQQRRILMVAPTGSGKTVIAAAIINDVIAQGRRALVLVHRRELVTQTSRKLYDVGVDAGIIQAGFVPRGAQLAQIASVQTLHARAIRSSTINMPDADLVFVDECHHVRAKTYEEILKEYPSAKIIGLTATPVRGDGRGLGKAFDTIIECPDVSELVKLGFLVPTKVYAPSRPNLSGVRVQAGEYVGSQLEARMDTDELVGNITEHWLRLNPDRLPTIIFASGVNHSVHIRNELSRAGVLAAHIDGSTPTDERDATLKDLASGRIEVVCNCMVLTEGFDCPDVGCLVLARPTKSMGLYRQMIGRGLRPAPGKKEVLVLDHSGAVFEHGYVDDPISWTLDEDKRAVNKAQDAYGAYKGMPRLTTCPECTAVRFQGRPCSVCGWRPQPRPQDYRTANGELGEAQRDRSVAAPTIVKQEFYAMLLYIADQRGYKRGWAWHKFKEKFHHFASGYPTTPKPPDEACRQWVRSRQIAWAKSKQKESTA
jgi:superfamily II DNA or RNA helicase